MRRQPPVQGRTRDERGVVAVWLAITMIVLLGFAGWAIDFAHWNDERANLQKAADAAALAGAVYLPDDPAGAIAAAKDIAAKNGYSSGVSVSTLANANQLKVKISTNVKSSFAQAVGIGSADLSKQATSEYESPKPLDMVLILDRTGSMKNDLANAQDAARDLLTFLNPKTDAIALGVLGPSTKTKTCTGANAGAYGAPDTSSDVGTANNTWMAAPYPLKAPSTDYKTGKVLNPSSQIVKTVNCLTVANLTDLGDPIAAATSYLNTYGRAGSKRGIIMMTDGEANLPSGTPPCQYANTAATTAKAAGIQVLTIGFGIAGKTCSSDSSGSFKGSTVTRLLASMASPIKGVPANDNGCTDAENSDGDNFFCQPKTADLSSVFVAAAAQLAGRLPRIVQ